MADRGPLPSCRTWYNYTSYGHVWAFTGIHADDEDVVCTTNGWLKEQEQNYFSTREFLLWRIAGPSTYQLQEKMLKNNQIWCTYVVVNCVRLRTFWTPLVRLESKNFAFVFLRLTAVKVHTCKIKENMRRNGKVMARNVSLLCILKKTPYIVAKISPSTWYCHWERQGEWRPGKIF